MRSYKNHKKLCKYPSPEDLLCEYYTQFKKSIYTYLLELTKDSSPASDLTQNVFLKFWTLKDQYVKLRNFKAFLMQMAKKAFRDTCRQDKNQDVYIHAVSYNAEVSLYLMETMLDEKELERAFQQAILDLSKQRRFVFVLSQTEGWPLEKIATTLGISPFTVKVTLQNALRRRCVKNAAFLINFQLTKTNKMRKSILCLLGWSLPFLLIAQSNTSTQSMVTKEGPGAVEGKGIQWTTGLSWEQIKQKAKSENKYIFIDAYTTWCGPCKMMEKNVYPNDTVGDLFNAHFIAVKAQMDKTEKDRQTIKDWYNDAETIEKEFAVKVYPTLIFLSPDAEIIQKEEGYKPVQEFVSIGKETLIPSKLYNNAYREYKTLLEDYKKGIKHYDRMPFMINKALELNDGHQNEFFKEYLEYVSKLGENERYTKENINIWSSFILKLDSKALGFFLKDGDKIDKVMGQTGYSREIVDKTIQTRIVDSFFRMQKGKTRIWDGSKFPNSEIMFVQLPVRADGKMDEPDYVEADWKTLQSMIRKYFNTDYAARNVLTARYRWYEQHQNRVAALKVYFTKLEKWPPVKLESETNDFAWHTFLYTNDKKLLKEASEWQKKLIEQWPGRHEFLDTYASLLYKLGRTDEAIQWEKKALDLVSAGKRESYMKTYESIIQKMKKREPTYIEQGAIWMNK